MKVEQIYTGCLAQGAYYIEHNGEAAIIDPLRETQPYLDKLEENGVQLKYIFETHFHADFVSGHIDLAQKTGATIVFGPMAHTDYAVYSAKDGEELKVGDLTIKVLHTPGHTLESSTFLLKNKMGKDYAVFTGDTLFLGDVGRPDLAIKQGKLTKEDLAAMLFDSLRNKIMPLADEVIVFPAHGAGSACGKNLSKETQGILGEQKQSNYALRADMSKAEFVQEVTAGLMPAPQYFAANAILNKSGYTSFDSVLEKGAIALSPQHFMEIMESESALILDVRTQQDFVKAHIPGSIFIGLNGNFAPWVGALITNIKQPILLVTPEGKEEEAVTRLARVGYDNTLGYLAGGITAWKNAGNELAHISSISVETYAKQLDAGEVETTLDMRTTSEYLAQHLSNTTLFPLDFINQNMHRLQRDKTYFVHCGSGFRSVIGISILMARGFDKLVDIANGWKAIEPSDLTKSEFVCPTTMTQETLDTALEAVL